MASQPRLFLQAGRRSRVRHGALLSVDTRHAARTCGVSAGRRGRSALPSASSLPLVQLSRGSRSKWRR
jgi:hypothetical protein